MDIIINNEAQKKLLIALYQRLIRALKEYNILHEFNEAVIYAYNMPIKEMLFLKLTHGTNLGNSIRECDENLIRYYLQTSSVKTIISTFFYFVGYKINSGTRDQLEKLFRKEYNKTNFYLDIDAMDKIKWEKKLSFLEDGKEAYAKNRYKRK